MKYRWLPSYSIAPASVVARLVPEVNFNGAVEAVAVPALRCRRAVGAAVPMPTLPPDDANNTSLLPASP